LRVWGGVRVTGNKPDIRRHRGERPKSSLKGVRNVRLKRREDRKPVNEIIGVRPEE